MKENNLSTQSWFPIQCIYEKGIIKINSQRYLKILEIKPIQYNLKTQLEKDAILNSYKVFLKTCTFDIQIIIQSNLEDLSHIISKVQKKSQKKENDVLKTIKENYIKYIQMKNKERKSSSKKYYVIIKNNINYGENIKNENLYIDELNEKYLKIKETLSRCGNSVIECSKEDTQKIFFSFLNSKNYFNQF